MQPSPWRQPNGVDELLPARRDWPVIWPQIERAGSTAPRDGHTLLTFEGHGHYGAAVSGRNQALSDAGFVPQYLGHDRGFGKHLQSRAE